MAVQWPAVLKQRLNQGGWQYQHENTNIQTKVETGPKKLRRRYTVPESLMSGSIWFDTSEYDTLENFFNLTLQNGSLPFEFPHPITQIPTVWVFEEPITYTTIGGVNFQASMVWRETQDV